MTSLPSIPTHYQAAYTHDFYAQWTSLNQLSTALERISPNLNTLNKEFLTTIFNDANGHFTINSQHGSIRLTVHLDNGIEFFDMSTRRGLIVPTSLDGFSVNIDLNNDRLLFSEPLHRISFGDLYNTDTKVYSFVDGKAQTDSRNHVIGIVPYNSTCSLGLETLLPEIKGALRSNIDLYMMRTFMFSEAEHMKCLMSNIERVGNNVLSKMNQIAFHQRNLETDRLKSLFALLAAGVLSLTDSEDYNKGTLLLLCVSAFFCLSSCYSRIVQSQSLNERVTNLNPHRNS